MLVSELKTRVWERLEEDESSPKRYLDSLLEEYAMEGERLYVVRTGCLTTTQTITQTASTLMYVLNDDCVQVERVLWSNGGIYYPVSPTTPRELDGQWAFQARWVNQTGTRATQYFIFGMNRIALLPMLSTSTQTYIVHYQQDIPASTELLETMPIEDHELLVYYTAARFLLAEGKVDRALEEYAVFKKGMLAATRRMASVDRVWARSHRGSLA